MENLGTMELSGRECETPLNRRDDALNRKTKKWITTVISLLFFAGAAVLFYFRSDLFEQTQGNTNKITGVLDFAEPDVTPDLTPATASGAEPQEQQTKLVVYVCGAVKEPGIYTLTAESRLYEAVTMAGGFLPEADSAYHNLARSIEDGERIYILSREETRLLTVEQQVNGETGTADRTQNQSAKINLNTATMEQLMELPGIGETKAAGILAYRERIGQFADIEEIRNVSGIGEAMYEKIKDKITVK